MDQTSSSSATRKEFQMSEEEKQAILDACKPVPVMFISGGEPMASSQQENANRAWSALGDKLGFDYMTVRPVNGKDNSFFTAISKATPPDTQPLDVQEQFRNCDETIDKEVDDPADCYPTAQ